MNATIGTTVMRIGGLLALLGLLCACGDPPGEREIEKTRVATVASRPAVANATPEKRFGGGMPSPVTSGPPESDGTPTPVPPFVWEVPEGWTELPTTRMRMANFQVAGDPRAECYLSFLPGSAGGLEANVNRWRSQMGLEPLSAEEVARLERRLVLEREATIVDMQGDFSGMSGEVREDYALVGAILANPSGTLFVKMTGPREVVDRERAAFTALCDSLEINPEMQAAAEDPHAGHDHPPGEGHGEEAEPAAAEVAGGGRAGSGGFTWTVPDGWRPAEGSSMRLVTYALGESGETQCYAMVLGGDGGGLEPNVNRWRGQLGLPPLSAEEVAGLEAIEVLGREATLFEGYGDFSGMGSREVSDAGMLGLVCSLDGATLFVKMVGAADEVRDAREEFVEFCRSLGRS